MKTHGYTIGQYYYLTSTTNVYTDIKPTTGIIQQLFYVIDADTLLVDIQNYYFADKAFSVSDIKAIYHNGTNFTEAKADDVSTLAELILLGDTVGNYESIKQGKVRFAISHSYGTGGETLYLSTDTAGEITNVAPTSGQIQIVGYVEDDKTVIIDINTDNQYFQYERGEVFLSSTVSVPVAATYVDVLSFTIPSAGKYKINAQIHSVLGINTGVVFGLAYPSTASGAIEANTENLADWVGNATLQAQGVSNWFIDVPAAGTYKVRARALTSAASIYNDTNGRTKVSWEKVAGYLPMVDPLAAEYLHATLTTAASYSSGQFINGFTTTTSTGLTLNSSPNTVTLKAGVTYKLEASFGAESAGGGYSSYQWFDTSGVAYGNQTSIRSMDSTAYGSNQPIAYAIITPTSNISVGVKCIVSSLSTSNNRGFIKIEAIAGQLPVATINDQSALKYVDVGTVRIQWGTVPGGSSTGTITLPAAFANSNYTINGSITSTSTNTALSVNFNTHTSTTVNYSKTWSNSGGSGSIIAEEFRWQAIGLKP